ncbi:MAG TPA: sortase [Candidatus Sulfotelmatobacter sp.]|nr:sortase [Candidatus Sulfotelmatobacter sp.]
MSKGELLRFLILRTIGNFLVLFAIFGILATFGPAVYYEISFKIIQFRGVQYVIAATSTIVPPTPTPTLIPGQPTPQITPSPIPTPTPVKSIGVDNFGEVLTGPKVQILTPKDTKFSIIIPKIGASAKIFPNVDPTNENEFLPILLKGVAHAKGTVFPGMKGNIYLFAHSTDNFWDVGRYNAVFYLLKDLQPGDDIVIFFENKRHDYIVKSSKIVNPSDVSYIVNSQKQNKEQLILQTCWPPGTAWQRLLVFAEPK